MNIPSRHDPAQLADEAATWLAKHDMKTVDVAAFEKWRAQSPDHAVAFARAYAAWEITARLRGDLDQEATPAPQADNENHAELSRRTLLRAVAAGGAVTLIGAGFIGTRAFAWSRAQTAIGETKRVPLPDGSLAVLNTDSSIAWKFDSSSRRLRLEQGEVALEVRSGQAPFSLLHSRDSANLSAGRFNARANDRQLNLLVLMGEAHLTSAEGIGGSVASTQHALIIDDKSAQVQIASTQNLAAAAAWQKGEILFDDEPLASAVGEYNRYLSKKIVIADPRIANVRVGGRFISTDPAIFFDALQTTLSVKVHSTQQEYQLSAR